MRLAIALLFCSSAFAQIPMGGITAGGGGAASPIVFAVNGSGLNSPVTTTSATSTGSTEIYVMVGSFSTDTGTITISDQVTSPSCASPCNTWVHVSNGISPSVTTANATLWFCHGCTTGSGHTFTATGGNVHASPIIAVGVNNTTGTTVDNTSTYHDSTGSTGTGSLVAALSPSHNDMCIAVAVNDATNILTAGTYTIPAGANVNFNSGVTVAGAIAWSTCAAASSQNPVWTWSGASTTDWIVGLQSFQ